MTLAVGFFDGVHLGHQAILDGADAALTFRTHPLAVVAPERAPRLLMDFETRRRAIMSCGVREVRAFDFTEAFSRLSPDEFVVEAGISPGDRVRCGANWRFGRGGAGDAAYLRARGVEVDVVPYVVYRGERVSSTRIRAALEAGAVEDANAMLGRPYEVRGRPFSGKGEGARLGFPTVNIVLDPPGPRLPLGVYAVEAGGRRAVANYGFAPTFGPRAWKTPVMEVHVLSSGDVGAFGPVALLRYLRPERTFASLEELKSQVARDCEEAESLAAGRNAT